MARSWSLGEILEFPEAIDPVVKALFEKPSEYTKEGDSYLQNMVPRSSLTLGNGEFDFHRLKLRERNERLSILGSSLLR